jgi:hypothetical protein
VVLDPRREILEPGLPVTVVFQLPEDAFAFADLPYLFGVFFDLFVLKGVAVNVVA